MSALNDFEYWTDVRAQFGGPLGRGMRHVSREAGDQAVLRQAEMLRRFLTWLKQHQADDRELRHIRRVLDDHLAAYEGLAERHALLDTPLDRRSGEHRELAKLTMAEIGSALGAGSKHYGAVEAVLDGMARASAFTSTDQAARRILRLGPRLSM